LQVANVDFFLKTLPLFDAGDDVGMVLSPQSFNNVNPKADIFNHGNIQFWEYAQRGYDALGFISCTGAPLSHHSYHHELQLLTPLCNSCMHSAVLQGKCTCAALGWPWWRSRRSSAARNA
jgi:hypothetical protein